jgi:putative protease
LCKGRFDVEGSVYHAIEEPVSLNTMDLLPDLKALGICAVKIEGRQRSPAYIADVARTWGQALDGRMPILKCLRLIPHGAIPCLAFPKAA